MSQNPDQQHEHLVDDTDSIDELRHAIDDLEDRIRISESPKRLIFKGLLTGLAGSIGATIMFGILLAIISWILYHTHAFPELNEMIQSLGFGK